MPVKTLDYPSIQLQPSTGISRLTIALDFNTPKINQYAPSIDSSSVAKNSFYIICNITYTIDVAFL